MSCAVKEISCRHCGAVFIGYANSQYCSAECRRRAENLRKKDGRKRRRMRAAPLSEGMTVRDVLAWIERHYEKTGVLLSYGKAVARLREKEAT